MTERLYYTDSYLRQFAASVLESADGGRRVYLDRTAFYPTSGGQPFDLGDLGGSPVVDVVDEGERIAHLLAAPVTGIRINGRVDWTRRFDHMQQHTGQHLLSAVIADRFGHATVSVYFGADASTLDLDTGTIPPDLVAEAERRANEVATENRPVRVSFEDAATAAALRKASDREGTLRIVAIDDLDRSACGGTHVRATGEIGPILIRKVERVKQLVRLEFLCGGRAVRRARGDGDLLARLSTVFSAAPAELPSLVERQRIELKESVAEKRRLEEQLSAYRAAELYAAASPGADGRRLVVVREEHGPADRLRTLGQAVARFPGAVFIAVVANPLGVLLATADDSGVDAGKTLRTALEQTGGRGGGNARLAQGSVPDRAGLETVVRTISR
ncbi:MAG: alanyl-tRNA editing protein [Gemmatimonadales bacterium]